jgi:RNA recognition motif-containing protein
MTGNPRGFAFIHLTLPATAEIIISLKKNHIIDAKTVDVKRAHARTLKANNPQILVDEDVFFPTSDEALHVEVDQMDLRIQEEIPETTFSTTTTPTPAATTKTTSTTPCCYKNNNINNNNNNKIFIGGLHPSVDREELKAHFSIYGYIKDACVMFDPKTKRSRGFGFITYQEGYQAYCAINQRHTFRDKVVELKYAQPKLSAVGQQPTQQQQQSLPLPPSPPTTTTTTRTAVTTNNTSTQQNNHCEDYEEKEEEGLMCFMKQTQLQKEICQLQKSVQDIRQSERLLISLLHNLVNLHNAANYYDVTKTSITSSSSTSTATQKHHNLMVAIIQSLQRRVLSKQGKKSFTPFHDPIATINTSTTTTTNNNYNKVNTTSIDNISLESLSSDSSLVDMIVQLDHCLASWEHSK